MAGLLTNHSVHKSLLLLLFIGMSGDMQSYSFCTHHAFSNRTNSQGQDTLLGGLEYGNTLGIVFRVQIISSNHPIYQVPENFNGVENVEEYYEEGIYCYLSGYTEDYGYARDVLLNQLRQRGFIHAEVLAFRSGERMVLEDALKMIEESRKKDNKVKRKK